MIIIFNLKEQSRAMAQKAEQKHPDLELILKKVIKFYHKQKLLLFLKLIAFTIIFIKIMDFISWSIKWD